MKLKTITSNGIRLHARTLKTLVHENFSSFKNEDVVNKARDDNPIVVSKACKLLVIGIVSIYNVSPSIGRCIWSKRKDITFMEIVADPIKTGILRSITLKLSQISIGIA